MCNVLSQALYVHFRGTIVTPSENPLVVKSLTYEENESSGQLPASLSATISSDQNPDNEINSSEPRSHSPTEENIDGEDKRESIATVTVTAAAATTAAPTAATAAAAAVTEMNTDLVKTIMRTMCDMITGDDGDETNVKAAGSSGIGGSSRVLLLRAGVAGAVVVTARTHIGKREPCQNA